MAVNENKQELETLAEIREINASFPNNKYVKDWKEGGKKVIGWFCNYTPEEVIHAAGILPVKILGGFEEFPLDKANAYFYPTSCSTVRSCFQLAFEGHYDFLDGFVMWSPCEHARRFYDVWTYWLKTPFHYAGSLLFIHGDESVRHYREGLVDFRTKLEEFTGVKIEENALRESTKLYNRTRELLKELNELRKSDNPPISGAEALEIMNACLATPKEDFNRILERLVEEAKSVSRAWVNKDARLLFTGSMWNNPDFLKFIEDQGCLIVVNELCNGMRYWSDPVGPDSDPLQALAERYMNCYLPCNSFYPWEPRIDQMVETARAYRVDGVINNLVRYCVALGFMRPLIKERLAEKGFPCYDLEQMYGAKGSGQVKTRIQAFLEMIEFAKEDSEELFARGG